MYLSSWGCPIKGYKGQSSSACQTCSTRWPTLKASCKKFMGQSSYVKL